MQVTSSSKWGAFLHSRGLALLKKKLPRLSRITKHFTPRANAHKVQLFTSAAKKVTATKDGACIQYETVKQCNGRVRARRVKELGIVNVLYLLDVGSRGVKCPVMYMGLVVNPVAEGPFVKELESECRVTTRYSVGRRGDLVWAEESAELRTLCDDTPVYKAAYKVWEQLASEDRWGEGRAEKVLGKGVRLVANEKWKDCAQERFRDFWAEKMNEAKVIYRYGQKERNDNLVTVIDRWERKTEGTADDFEYDEKFNVEFEGKSWGAKDGKKGTENFHEKWTADQDKFTEKWSDQRQPDGSLKKWGEKVRELSDGTREVEKWDEFTNAEGNYTELTIKKNTNHSNGSKSGENIYKNSANKVWHEYWEESKEARKVVKSDDDGYGHKTVETTGAGFGAHKYTYSDKYREDVALGEKYTEKTGYNEESGDKWVMSIYDNDERNYVENVGENKKTTDKWTEKWFDDKKGTKWAVKEGSNAAENRKWKEQWNEKYEASSVEKKCEKWGKDNDGEWLEKWEEEYRDDKCLHKFCEKSYKSEGYCRKYKVDQYNKGDPKDGKDLWWYKTETWENDKYDCKEFEQYE